MSVCHDALSTQLQLEEGGSNRPAACHIKQLRAVKRGPSIANIFLNLLLEAPKSVMRRTIRMSDGRGLARPCVTTSRVVGKWEVGRCIAWVADWLMWVGA
ncbi:hypothetical protein B0T16DRAFT_177397 [Cercophora newfieldiana]|uniref:Uncharacterized protein n=1 Tax=Cercophora newfieldiana TaxID=92897 RepID=A0AA39XZI7_9PEZI|nr:hypothetical protein B0T16DRAFT_177397 [Cercophora newfieldiana]